MTGHNGREPVDLARYKKAAQARAKADAAAKQRINAAPQGSRHQGPEPLLGRRRHAGLILALAAVGFLALSLGPRLL